jgi:hypothetical protein
MKRGIIVLTFVFASTHVFSQKGFSCEMNEVDSLLTPTEKCIIECIKQLQLERYLGHENVAFFDSIINCSFKKTILWAERKGYYYTAIIFQLTDNLQIRLYPGKILYGNKLVYSKGKNSTLKRQTSKFLLKSFWSEV